MQTVPSIKKNEMNWKVNNHQYKLIDYNGDNLSKEETLSGMDSVHTIIHVIDGTNLKSLGDAAMFIYRVLINKSYQRNNCNYIIFLNKTDRKGFMGKEKAEKHL